MTDPTIDRMLFIGGSKTSFRCDCGGNVFKQFERNRFRCNSCGATYTADEGDQSDRSNVPVVSGSQ